MEKPDGSRPAVLLLEDGTLFLGKGFGAEATVVGELVFNTGMVGYPESMTDPSYAGQVLCFTYPLIGNYGVPSGQEKDVFGLPRHFESSGIKVTGLVVQEHCAKPSHWASVQSPIEITSTPGCLINFYNQIARRHVNIEDTVSCHTDTIIVVKMKEVGRAFTSLTNLISEERKRLEEKGRA